MKKSEKRTSMTFTSYEKIADSVARWQLDEAGARLLEKTEWIVTEKVHGANFCFVTDGQVVRCAKRKRLLEQGESFFNHHRVLQRLTSQIKEAFGLVKRKEPHVEKITIYGELFGGDYPHPDVKGDPSVQSIQTGVYYCPSVDFYAFDIIIEGAIALEGAQNRAFTRRYLDYDQALHIFEQSALFHATSLFVGKFQQACAYPIGFESTIPLRLGLPPLENNKAEGIIIKPVTTIYIETKKGLIRPILKKKIPDFAEDKRFHQAQNWSEQQKQSPDDSLSLLKWELFNLITQNRLQNAISKIGLIDHLPRQNSRALFREFIEDVLTELASQQPEQLQGLAGAHERELLAYLKEETRALFKKIFET